jgi:hypothetical protein
MERALSSCCTMPGSEALGGMPSGQGTHANTGPQRNLQPEALLLCGAQKQRRDTRGCLWARSAREPGLQARGLRRKQSEG